LERPVQLIFHLPSAGDTQRAYELLEVDRPALIRVEYFEHIVCKRRWVTKGKELSVYLLELFFCECP
jgi:hypothetical protein